MTNEYFLKKAKQVATKSTMYQMHGCVIVRNNIIVSSGYNRNVKFFEHHQSIHAEVDALNKLGKKNKKFLSECDVYVVRIATDDKNILRLSRPCENCARALLKSKVRNIYYSVDNEDYSCKIIYSDRKKVNNWNISDLKKRNKNISYLHNRY